MNTYIQIEQAKKLHQEGNLREASLIYEAVLKIDPENADSMHLLGLVAAQSDKHELAVNWISQALAISPENSKYHNNLGTAWVDLKQFAKAIESYDSAIQYKEDYADAYFNKGLALIQLKDWGAAALTLKQALVHQPRFFEAMYLLGNTLQELGRFDEAITNYKTAISLNTNYAPLFYNLGNAFKAKKQFDAAIENYDKSLVINPRFVDAYVNRGVALKELRHFEAAIKSHDRALSVNKECAQAYLNRGNALKELNRFEEAIADYEKAISFKADYAEAYCNLAITLDRLLRTEQALAYYDIAINIKNDYVQAHWNKAVALLLLGKYQQGWKSYEWRWLTEDSVKKKKKISKPLWLGKESIQGKTILIHAEQGLGDTLQFIRYVPMVAALGARVMVEVQAPLLSLFENMQGISVLLKKGDPLPPFDFHCPMMSLPLAFKTTLDTVPSCPQLVIPEEKKQYWANKLGLKAKPRVGLVWNGGFRPDQPEIWDVNERRNLPLQHLKALVGIDVEFISLQKGEPAESEFRQTVASGWDGPVIHDHVIELKDFSDTAALVMNLDLVIAVDTSTAHLAASLGKPVWLLNRYDACWRWLLERDDSPWYPSIKIYRQTSSGDWDGVMQRVRSGLLELASRNAKK